MEITAQLRELGIIPCACAEVHVNLVGKRARIVLLVPDFSENISTEIELSWDRECDDLDTAGGDIIVHAIEQGILTSNAKVAVLRADHLLALNSEGAN